ncbi:hypothetical protein [Streptomyces antibioticus]|uniref:hypothetical protein n=1 Tax=Streptomyces antibioticus TaxID=1890 RepID=UPI0036FBFB8D
MTPADELHAAAAKLRAATFRGAITATPAVAALISARKPLALWLENTATSLAANTHPGWQEYIAADALAVARAILGTKDRP